MSVFLYLEGAVLYFCYSVLGQPNLCFPYICCKNIGYSAIPYDTLGHADNMHSSFLSTNVINTKTTKIGHRKVYFFFTLDIPS